MSSSALRTSTKHATTEIQQEYKKFSLTTYQKAGQFLNYFGLQFSRPFYYSTISFIRGIWTVVRPDELGNYHSHFLEKIRRTLGIVFPVVFLPITVPMTLFGGIIDCAGNYLKQTSYFYIKGSTKEEMPKSEYKFFSLNVNCYRGGIPYAVGATKPAGERIKSITNLLKSISADIFVLQEVSFDIGLLLSEEEKKEYAHFFTQIGPNPFLLESGLFLGSKLPILDKGFIAFPGQSGIKRGAFFIETPDFFFFTTHLQPSEYKQDKDTRKHQLNLITKKIQECKQRTNKPCFLMGDLNIQRTDEKDSEYFSSEITASYFDPYGKKYPNFNEQTATCTNYFTHFTKGQEIPQILSQLWEIDDYALIDRDSASQFTLDVNLISAFELSKPDQALSDHRGLLLTASKV